MYTCMHVDMYFIYTCMHVRIHNIRHEPSLPLSILRKRLRTRNQPAAPRPISLVHADRALSPADHGTAVRTQRDLCAQGYLRPQRPAR